MSERARKFFPEIFWGGNKIPGEENDTEKRFEVGTPSIPEILGFNKALSFIECLNFEKLRKKRLLLRSYAIKKLEKIENLVIYNKKNSDSIILFNLTKFHSHDVANFLAKNNVFVRAGNLCSPFINDLIGVKSAIRASIALYNTKREIDMLIEFLEKINIDNIF